MHIQPSIILQEQKLLKKESDVRMLLTGILEDRSKFACRDDAYWFIKQ